jgi:hypothetical protein
MARLLFSICRVQVFLNIQTLTLKVYNLTSQVKGNRLFSQGLTSKHGIDNSRLPFYDNPIVTLQLNPDISEAWP